MFDVSFDYLMDDSINTLDQKSNDKHMKILKRAAFSTGIPISHDQVDIDNGYYKTRRSELSNDEYCENNIRYAKEVLEKLNITDVFQIQKDTAIFFFFDAANCTCGFFYGGMIQFLCPIENLLGFTYRGGNHQIDNSSATVGSVGFGLGGINSVGVGKIPTVTAVTDTSAWCCLSYKNGDSIEQFEMKFSVNSSYNVKKMNIESPEMLDAYWRVQVNVLLKNLEKLQLKIYSLVSVGKDISSGAVKVKKIDYGKIEELNKELKAKYDAYIKSIKDEAFKDNMTGLLVKVAIAVAIPIVCFLIANQYFSCL